MTFESKLIPSVKIWPNDGQISGIPKNPRFIRDERFDALVKSIIDDVEMLQLRELLVVPYADEYVAIVGNMRLKAVIHVRGMDDDDFMKIVEEKQDDDNFNEWLQAITAFRSSKDILCKVIPIDTPIEKIKAYIIKDNVGFGQDDYDLLANEWDEQELTDWGMILPDLSPIDDQDGPIDKVSKVRLTIEFDELAEYDTVRIEIEDLLTRYPGAKLKS